MIAQNDYAKIEDQLQKHLAARFEDVSVRVGDDIHYKGTNVIVTSSHFAGWLPEQRFHHIVRALPQEFYEKYLRVGMVWFELAPGEQPKQYMKMPRSEDVADEDADIAQMLVRIGFAKKLKNLIADEGGDASPDDFELTRVVLAELDLDESVIEKVCLFLIGRGAFCDAHVVKDVLPQLAGKKSA